MTQDTRKFGIEATVTDGTKPGLDSVKRSAAEAAQSVKTSADQASNAVGAIGDKGQGASEKLDRSTRSIVNSVQRATAALESGGATSAKYFETLASQRGVSTDALKPYLDQLKQAERAQQVATGSLDKMGLSAKQTTAALRQVPAQFTDIITSLQGGQAPLTVLLQQGGQLKDVFGGIGAAASALGNYLIGLINPFTAIAAAVGVLSFAYNIGSKEADEYRKALILTGNASGTTAGQMQAYAQQISAVVGTQGKAAEALAAFANSGKVGAENLKQFSQTAIEFERATGTAIGETAKKFAELRAAPLQASLKLNESTNFLTESIYKQIKALEEQGRATEAADVAQKAFDANSRQQAEEITKGLGSIERGWLSVKDAIKSAGGALLSIGRQSAGPESQIADIQKQIDAKRAQVAEGGYLYRGQSQADAEIKALEAKKTALELVASASLFAADAQRKSNEQRDAGIRFDKDGERFIKDRVKMERDLARAVNEGVAANKSQQEILDRISSIREQYAKKTKTTAVAENKDLQDQNRIYSELAGVSSSYYKDLSTAQAQRAKGLITEAQYVSYVEQLIQKQPFYTAQLKAEEEAVKSLRKARDDEASAQDRLLEQRQRSADAVGQQVQRLRDEEQAAGIAASENISLAQAIEKVGVARLREEQAQLKANGADEGTLLYLQKEIEAREQLIDLMGNKDAREAATKSAKDAADAWQKTAQSIENSLTDALMRGFESGKGFLQNLIDTTKNLFATLVLRPQIQAVLGIAGTGATGAANASQSGVGGLSQIGSLFGGNSFGVGIGSGLVSVGNGLVGLGFDKVGSGISGFANGAAGVSNLAYGAAGLLGGLAGGLFGGKGSLGGSLGSTLGLALSGGNPLFAGLGTLAGGALGSLFGKGTPYNAGGNFQARADGTGSRISDKSLFDLLPGLGKAGYEDFTKRQSPAFDTATKTLAEGLQGTLSSLLKTFGKEGEDVLVAFRNNGKKSLGQVNIGGVLTNFKTGENDPGKAFTAFTDAGAKALLEALDRADIPAWAKRVLDDVGDAPGLDALKTVATTIEQVQQLTNALNALPFENLKSIGEESAIALAELAGGLDGLQSSITNYYAEFYSVEERAAETTKQLTASLAALGLSIPSSRDAFRSLVNAQDISTEAGRKLYAELLKLAPAFASVTAASATAAAQVQDKAEAQRTLEARLAADQAAFARQEQAATKAYKDSIRSVTTSLFEEANRIRSLLSGGGAESFATAQSQFAIATARATAGDTEAAKLLPDLSQALLDLAANNVGTAEELARIRGLTAASLDATGNALNKQAGISYTPPPGLASVLSSSQKSTVQAVNGMQNEMVAQLLALRAATEKNAESSKKTADLLTRVTQDGDALVTTPL